MKICILDDDAALCRQLGSLITDFEKTDSDISLTLTDSVGQFFESAENANQFDIVFIAVDLKEENGIAVAEKLNALSPKTIVIF